MQSQMLRWRIKGQGTMSSHLLFISLWQKCDLPSKSIKREMGELDKTLYQPCYPILEVFTQWTKPVKLQFHSCLGKEIDQEVLQVLDFFPSAVIQTLYDTQTVKETQTLNFLVNISQLLICNFENRLNRLLWLNYIWWWRFALQVLINPFV